MNRFSKRRRAPVSKPARVPSSRSSNIEKEAQTSSSAPWHPDSIRILDVVITYLSEAKENMDAAAHSERMGQAKRDMQVSAATTETIITQVMEIKKKVEEVVNSASRA